MARVHATTRKTKERPAAGVDRRTNRKFFHSCTEYGAWHRGGCVAIMHCIALRRRALRDTKHWIRNVAASGVKKALRAWKVTYLDCPRVPRRRVVIWGNCWRIIYIKHTNTHRLS